MDCLGINSTQDTKLPFYIRNLNKYRIKIRQSEKFLLSCILSSDTEKYNSWKLNRTGNLPVNLSFAADEQPLWIGLKQRCNYSGSSLTVCELALNTFGSFRKFSRKVSKEVSKLYANHLHPKVPEIECKKKLLGEIFLKLGKHTVSRGFPEQHAVC